MREALACGSGNARRPRLCVCVEHVQANELDQPMPRASGCADAWVCTTRTGFTTATTTTSTTVTTLTSCNSKHEGLRYCFKTKTINACFAFRQATSLQILKRHTMYVFTIARVLTDGRGFFLYHLSFGNAFYTT